MRQQLDLSNCDKEKISLVGAVQPHGYFFAFRMSDQTLYHASLNASDLIGISASEVIGKSLVQIFGDAVAKIIITASKNVDRSHAQFVRVSTIKDVRGNFEIYLFELDGLIGLEIEPHHDATDLQMGEISESHRRSQVFVENLDSGESLGELARLTCKAIRSMIGFERVMMYRYLPNWDGEVVGEDKSAEAHSFMSHRFPATDIPLPARELYLKNRSRLIADSAAKAVAIEPTSHYLTRKTIDLSYSKLRAVSPVHLEYLKTMGVASSFSVAVIVRGELWGLIACHGKTMMVIPHEVRLACETIASTFAVLANMKERFEGQAKRLAFEQSLRAFFRKIVESPNLNSSVMKNYELILEMFQGTGLALVVNGRVDIAGLTPTESMIGQLALSIEKMMAEKNRNVLSLESLETLGSEFEVLKSLACGLVAVRAKSAGDSMMLIFRPEVLQTITWGGDPRKTMEKRDYQGVINPRKSFESWIQTVSGVSKPWQDYEVKGAEFFKDFVFEGLVKKERLLDELSQKAKLAAPSTKNRDS